MKNLKNIMLILAITFSMLLAGCSNNTKNENSTELTSQEISNNENKEENKVIDREGNEVVLPEKTDKIISLAPSITETLVNLGLSDNLVAVDKYSLEVEGVNKDLPVFDIMNPDAENIVALEPDIIFGTGMTKSKGTDPFAPMVEMGSFVTVVPTSTSIEGIKEDILYIGKVTNKEKEAQAIVEDFEKQIEDTLAMINKKEDKEPLKVYFETSPMPDAYTFGQDTFLNDMLNMLGATNIFGEESGWLAVSEEQIIAKNPDVIFTNADFLEDPIKDIKNRAGWENVNAVKNNRVYLIDKNSSSRANENSIKAFSQMAEFLYPELFNN